LCHSAQTFFIKHYSMKKTFSIIYISSIVLAISLVSCLKHKAAMPPNLRGLIESDENCSVYIGTCYDTAKISPPIMTFPNFHEAANYKRYATLNPNNISEVLFYKSYQPLFIQNIVPKNIIATIPYPTYATPLWQPKWSKKNKLLLANGVVFTMNINGDSIVQQTFTGAHHSTDWDYEGNRFVSEHFTDAKDSLTGHNIGKSSYFIKNIYTGVYDSILVPRASAGQRWNNQNGILAYPYRDYYDYKKQGYSILNTIDKSIYSILVNSLDPSIFSWVSNSSFVYFDNETRKLYKLDIIEKKQKCIGKICSNEVIGCLDFDYASNTLMLLSQQTKDEGDNKFLNSSRLYYYNLTTQKVTEYDL
jgi:hypothetical protein